MSGEHSTKHHIGESWADHSVESSRKLARNSGWSHPNLLGCLCFLVILGLSQGCISTRPWPPLKNIHVEKEQCVEISRQNSGPVLLLWSVALLPGPWLSLPVGTMFSSFR